MSIFDQLASPFPNDRIHWRAQTLTRDGSKALALAYLDARDVRQRLNEVVGHENWQVEFYDCGGGKLGCRIGLRIDSEWIWKSDGAGDTQVEAEKGAFSSALKRAAVAWGIGEYLYSMDAVWVPCKTWDKGGKKMFDSFTEDPWKFVKNAPPKQDPPADLQAERKRAEAIKRLNGKCDEIVAAIESAVDEKALDAVWTYHSTPPSPNVPGTIPYLEERAQKGDQGYMDRIMKAYNAKAASFNKLAAG